jgi:hypothetical protein
LLIVVCCLLLSASTIAIVVANPTSTSASAVNAASSASTAYAAATALAFRPGGASRGWGQQTPWSSPGGVERGKKKSITFCSDLSPTTTIFTNGIQATKLPLPPAD